MTIGEQLKLSNKNQKVLHLITEGDFFKAVKSGNRNEVRKYANQVDINIKDSDGWTALMYATDTDDRKMISLLIELGADVNMQDDDGQTALMNAIFVNATKSANYLIKHGANINIRDNNGQTPLMIAAFSNEPEIGELLILEGANIDDVDNSGLDAFSIARQTWSFKKAEYFLNTKPINREINIKRIIHIYKLYVKIAKEGDIFSLKEFNDLFINKYGYEVEISDIEAALLIINGEYKDSPLKLILSKEGFILSNKRNIYKIVRNERVVGFPKNETSFWDGYQEYLIERGYSLITPSGHPSTVYEYRNAVSNIKSIELFNLPDFCMNIDYIIEEYDIGGEKESLGRTKHNTWINALKRFREYLHTK